MHLNFILKSQSFYLSLYFWSVAEAIFPSRGGEGKENFVGRNFKMHWGMGLKNFLWGRPNFSVGEGFVGSVT